MFGIKKKKELVVYSDENKLFDTLLYTSINLLLITLNVYTVIRYLSIHRDSSYFIISPIDQCYHHNIFLIHIICFKIKI